MTKYEYYMEFIADVTLIAVTGLLGYYVHTCFWVLTLLYVMLLAYIYKRYMA